MMRFLQGVRKKQEHTGSHRLRHLPLRYLWGLKYKIVTNSDYYVYDEERQIWRNSSDDEAYVSSLWKTVPI